MTQTTSVHVKPCNIGSSEAHNRRSAEYLAHINRDRIYIRTDLSDRNEEWTGPALGDRTLTEHYDEIGRMVKEKTGRAMQTKDRERINKKTGKKTIISGSTPIKEGVVVIGEDTTMQQLQKFCADCRERWGITALQIFIHRDEGHCEDPQRISSWKPNHHAHIVWDWMDHETGKSLKLNADDMSEMQTLLAECLDMERGVSKEQTDRRHLAREDYIIAKQQEKAEQAKADRDAALRKADNEKQQGQIAVAEKDDYIKKLHRKLDMHSAVLRIFAEMLYAAGKVFKRAIDAIVELATNKFKAIFDDSQAADIRSVMRQYGKTEEEMMAVGDWMCDYAQTLHPLDESDSRMIRKEVGDIAKGKYDWRNDQDQGYGMSR